MSVKLSACTITKNEALNIKKSIDSYKEYVDEIIIVDTGSVDETVEIAKKAGAKVFEFEWENDFSAAKNFALSKCTGDWVIFLDADEWFDNDDAKNIQQAIENTVQRGFSGASCKLVNFADENEILEVGCTLRIFKRDKNIVFDRPIHEIVFDKVKNYPLESLYTELLTINHSGYMRKILQSKAERNKKLLDRTYAEGKATPIDYFYGLRENLNINVGASEYFYKLINNIPNYREKISKYSIGASLDDSMFKLVNKLPNKYSFEERLEVLKTAQRFFPDNPVFKYYEYKMFADINRKRAISALLEAVELNKDYEKKNRDKINAFYASAGDAYLSLGEYELMFGDKGKALEYFTNCVKYDFSNLKALIGILSIIKDQKNEEIVVFLNSIYDTNEKEVLQFLVEKLRLTSFHDVFLYYFVNFNKKFNEVDSALFTSRIITKNFEEIADTYMNVFNETKDTRALRFVTSAIILGNMKDKYIEISSSILPTYSRIINAYFNDEILENVSDSEYSAAFEIFNEIAFVVDDVTLKKYIKIFSSLKDKFWIEIIRYYFNFYSYDYVLKIVDWLQEEKFDNQDLDTYISYILTNVYFRVGAFDKIEETLDKAISGGFLNMDLFLICEALEATDDKLEDYYKLFDAEIEMLKVNDLDKLTDISSDSIFFMNIDKLKQEINKRTISCLKEQIKMFFDFATKAYQNKAFAYAEKYYKIALKFNCCTDKCYYYLGEIYNHFNKPELSAYCYERAFCENPLLSSNLLPATHKNYNYVFSKKEEEHNKLCPICGKEGRPVATYSNIEDEELGYSNPVIATYMKCEDCKHVFLKNDIKDCSFWEKMNSYEVVKPNIEKLYRYFELINKFSSKNKILTLSCSKEFMEISKNLGYEVWDATNKNVFPEIVFGGNCLEQINNLDDKMECITKMMTTGGMLVIDVYDFESLYSTSLDKPLWAKANVKNVFSRNSIEKLFEKYGLKITEFIVDNFDKGKVMILAIK